MISDLRFTQLKILNGIKNSDFTAQRCLHKHLWETDFEVQVGSDWEAQRQRLEQHQPFQDLIIHRSVQSGEECYLSLSGKPVFDGAQQFTGYRGIAKDVTARKRAELAAVRLGRMYAALSATEEAILRTRSPAELFQRVCDAAVDGGKFLTTAVLLKKPNEKKLHLTAGSGHGLEVLQTTDISLDETQPSESGSLFCASDWSRPR